MGTEIERKFLVLPHLIYPLLDHTKSEYFEQFYLARDPWVRVRIIQAYTGPSSARLTIKGPGTLRRAEFEYEIPFVDAVNMRPMGKGTIKKTRWKHLHEGHTWEIDGFEGDLTGLWLAEIELRDEREEFVVPPWVDREVTEDVRFSNAYLVEHGMPGVVR